MSPHAHSGSTRTSCRVKSIMATATSETASTARAMTGVGMAGSCWPLRCSCPVHSRRAPNARLGACRQSSAASAPPGRRAGGPRPAAALCAAKRRRSYRRPNGRRRRGGRRVQRSLQNGGTGSIQAYGIAPSGIRGCPGGGAHVTTARLSVSPPSPLPETGTGGGSGSTRRREAAQRCRPPPGSGGLSTPMSRRARSRMRSSRAWIRGAPANGGFQRMQSTRCEQVRNRPPDGWWRQTGGGRCSTPLPAARLSAPVRMATSPMRPWRADTQSVRSATTDRPGWRAGPAARRTG